jgi:hypothetical protein
MDLEVHWSSHVCLPFVSMGSQMRPRRTIRVLTRIRYGIRADHALSVLRAWPQAMKRAGIGVSNPADAALSFCQYQQ